MRKKWGNKWASVEFAFEKETAESREERLQAEALAEVNETIKEEGLQLKRGMTLADEWVVIPKKEFDAIERNRKKSSEGGKKGWANMTPEERSARAKKAVEARKKKLGW